MEAVKADWPDAENTDRQTERQTDGQMTDRQTGRNTDGKTIGLLCKMMYGSALGLVLTNSMYVYIRHYTPMRNRP